MAVETWPQVPSYSINHHCVLLIAQLQPRNKFAMWLDLYDISRRLKWYKRGSSFSSSASHIKSLSDLIVDTSEVTHTVILDASKANKTRATLFQMARTLPPLADP